MRDEGFTEQAITKVEEGNNQVIALDSSNRIFQQAITALENDAQSGQLDKRLWTTSASTAMLKNAINEAGLAFLAGANLGPINESELALALETIDEGLNEEALEEYLRRKMAATTKIRNAVRKRSRYGLSEGGTVHGWLEQHGWEPPKGGTTGGAETTTKSTSWNG